VHCGNQNKMDDTKTHTVTIHSEYIFDSTQAPVINLIEVKYIKIILSPNLMNLVVSKYLHGGNDA
jgi:hypothetical protein